MNNDSFSFFLNNSKPEENVCPMCELVDAYFHEIVEAETYDAIEEILHSLVEDAFQDGYTSALQDDVEVKTDLLNGMYQGF